MHACLSSSVIALFNGNTDDLYTKEFNNLKEVRKSLNIWFKWYNQERFHQSLDNLTPDEVYYQNQAIPQAA